MKTKAQIRAEEEAKDQFRLVVAKMPQEVAAGLCVQFLREMAKDDPVGVEALAQQVSRAACALIPAGE